MLTEERHDHIRRKLAAEGKVVAAELALEFDISEDTVRRDLRELARVGECRRVYGGALSPAPDLGSIAQRQGALVESKLSLARVVAGLVAPEQTLFVDAGSTNLAIAQALPRDLAITVVTNAPAVATALADHPNCRTMVIGGQFNSDKGACLGSHALRDIQRVRADLLILGTCGVDPRVGVSALDAEEAEIKRAMVEQSRQLVVPATADKIGTTAPFDVADTSRIDHLVVTKDADAVTIDTFRALGVTVHVAP
ncbi:DeoR/GlpR family DNA-binding transcription regulator [Devosia sp. ZB163]|uniref:DeoR/GlpR family DNA-binding transcription regulator n=1 Tax=Devosia sp. ZB163 TaxID=3025938 RepID=UPI0023610EF1|nr:DeoR/GlpR family DNA-binding transcription regulator [Devosia sp. ZB163]MDC9822920.1 DeoR/GlpR family DNA-binding transcription regulator [Devosia sp. ZB163]